MPKPLAHNQCCGQLAEIRDAMLTFLREMVPGP
jgi:hypothetical protein